MDIKRILSLVFYAESCQKIQQIDIEFHLRVDCVLRAEAVSPPQRDRGPPGRPESAAEGTTEETSRPLVQARSRAPERTLKATLSFLFGFDISPKCYNTNLCYTG